MSAEADTQLLLAFVKVFKTTAEDHEKLAEAMGGTVTANAIRQRIAKIRKKGPAAAASPVKNSGDKQTGTPTPGAKKRKGGKGGYNDSNEDDEETPVKKRKRRGVKVEQEDGEDVMDAPVEKVKEAEEEVDDEEGGDHEELYRSFGLYPEAI